MPPISWVSLIEKSLMVNSQMTFSKKQSMKSWILWCGVFDSVRSLITMTVHAGCICSQNAFCIKVRCARRHLGKTDVKPLWSSRRVSDFSVRLDGVRRMKPRCSNAAVLSLQGLVKQLNYSQHQVGTWNGTCWHRLFHHGCCCQSNLIWMQNNQMIASVRCVLAFFWSKFKSSCTYIRDPQQKTNMGHLCGACAWL